MVDLDKIYILLSELKKDLNQSLLQTDRRNTNYREHIKRKREQIQALEYAISIINDKRVV